LIFNKPITDIINQRFSCRSYSKDPITPEIQKALGKCARSIQSGPLGTPLRFDLAALELNNQASLKGLGTYGLIKNPTGFLVGSLVSHTSDLEDFGYMLEKIVLYATDLGLGSCWLGGSFNKSQFTRKFSVQPEERMPAIISIGYIPPAAKKRNDNLREEVYAKNRLPWELLFFENDFSQPLSREKSGVYAILLDMVQKGPSASNKQPWRIVRQAKNWHFYLKRSKGYRDSLINRLMKVEDLQRIDMGIAMCHFDLTAVEMGLKGEWVNHEPAIRKPDDLYAYTISWVEE